MIVGVEAVAPETCIARRIEGDEATQLWCALADGQYSVVDLWSADDRRMLLARRNDAGARDTRALTPREREVVALAAVGCSNKVIAYQLRMSTAAVAKHLRETELKLGVASRRELIELYNAERDVLRSEPPSRLEAHLIHAVGTEFVVFDWRAARPALPDALSLAERDVVEMMLEGASNAEIARARGTSIRTVARQAATAFRKLHVFSRLELFATLRRG